MIPLLASHHGMFEDLTKCVIGSLSLLQLVPIVLTHYGRAHASSACHHEDGPGSRAT